MKRRLSRIALLMTSIVVVMGLFEGCTWLLLARPRLLARLPPAFTTHARDVYLWIDRAIVQCQPDAVRYDADLFYTLRPGHFVFRSREFAHDFHVNRLGLRDDEQSLEAPTLVVVGDSYAMGWGVAQEDTFAQVIERLSGRRVLNAAISSYGTVREMRLLNRIDLSGATHLIVQYSANDADENLQFLRQGSLTISPQSVFEQMLAEDRGRRRYWPGRYALRLIQRVFEVRRARAAGAPPALQAEAFLHALANASRQKLDRLRPIVLVFDPPGFADALEAAVAAHTDLPAWIKRLEIVRLDQRLTVDDHWILDEHWNAHGHLVAAEAVRQALSR
jgi:hypothetical protein